MKTVPAFIARLTVLAAAVAFIAGCDSPRGTLEELRKEVAAYVAAPAGADTGKIDAGFQKLGAQIAELRGKGNNAEADALQQERDVLKARYTGAKMAAGLQGLQQAAKVIGNAVRQAGEVFGETLRGSSPSPEPAGTPE